MAFSLSDIQEMDAIISTLNAFDLKDAGPLYLTWAVFICLLTSLSEKVEVSILMVCIGSVTVVLVTIYITFDVVV